MLRSRILTCAILTDLKLSAGFLPGIHCGSSVPFYLLSTGWKVGLVGSGCACAPLGWRAETVFSVLTIGLTYSSQATVDCSNECFLAIPRSRGKVSQIRILGTGLRERTKQSCSAASGPGLGVHGVTSLRDRVWPQLCLGPMRFRKARVVEQGKGR